MWYMQGCTHQDRTQCETQKRSVDYKSCVVEVRIRRTYQSRLQSKICSARLDRKAQPCDLVSNKVKGCMYVCWELFLIFFIILSKLPNEAMQMRWDHFPFNNV